MTQNKHLPKLTMGNKIVNMINEKYNINLMTVDAAAMTEEIDQLLQSRILKFRIGLKEKIGSMRTFFHCYTLDQLVAGRCWDSERYEVISKEEYQEEIIQTAAQQ